MHKDLWRFSLIGYIASKFPGYTSLSKFINSSWKCNAKFSIHDSEWLIFTFSSEMDMIEVLSGGPYYVFGRPLIQKIMHEFFDFTTSEMVRMPSGLGFLICLSCVGHQFVFPSLQVYLGSLLMLIPQLLP
jgi:hypothetical protein